MFHVEHLWKARSPVFNQLLESGGPFGKDSHEEAETTLENSKTGKPRLLHSYNIVIPNGFSREESAFPE
jgi:hypothetical protein